MSAASSTDVYAVGGTFVPSGHPVGHVLHWNGASWLDQSTASLEAGDYFHSVTAGPAGVWAVGNSEDAFNVVNRIVETRCS